MHVRRVGSHAQIDTPAKVNLFLEVLGKRADGYHEIETLLVTVTLYDTLIFIPRSNQEIELACRWMSGMLAQDRARRRAAAAGEEPLAGEIPAGPENLVWRAAALLRERSGCQQG